MYKEFFIKFWSLNIAVLEPQTTAGTTGVSSFGTGRFYVITIFQRRSKGNISGGARDRRRREPLGGSGGGMLPPENFEI